MSDAYDREGLTGLRLRVSELTNQITELRTAARRRETRKPAG